MRCAPPPHRTPTSPQNCRGVGSGGALNANSKITIINGRFINCFAGQNGGAVYSLDVLTISGSYFNGTVAGQGVGGSGGAVFAVKTSSISTSAFVNTSAASGGAVFATLDVSVSGSSFDTCVARSGSGGGLYATPSALVAVSGSTFFGSSATSAGGSVFGYDSMTIAGSNFTSSASGTNGGAVAGGNNMTVQGSFFSICSARQSGGGVFAADYLTVSGSSFTSSSAQVSGGGVYAGVFAAVSSSRFSATSSASSGGALFASSNLTVTGSAFVGASATQGSGGAIYGTSMVLTASSFSGTSSQQGPGGAVFVKSDVCIVTGCLFASTVSQQDGGAVYVETGGSLAVTQSQFTGCQSLNGNGGALGSSLPQAPLATPPVPFVVTSSTFSLNSAPLGTGGAVSSTYVLLTFSAFSNNSALNGGGVGMSVYFSYLQDYGNTFTFNKARLAGGAVYSPCWSCAPLGQAVVTSNSSAYTGNEANGLTPHGGAIAAYKSMVTVQNCTFTSNRATYLTSASQTEQIPASTFGQLSGGALLMYAPVGLSVASSTFVSNSAERGGAVCVTADTAASVASFSGTVLVANSTFSFNNASGEDGGGAISAEAVSTVSVSGSTFGSNAAASGVGGAILLNMISSLAQIDQSRFTNNAAGSAGCVFFTFIAGTPRFTNSVAQQNRCGGVFAHNSGRVARLRFRV